MASPRRMVLVGFADAQSLDFVGVGVSPGQYRERFRAAA